MKVKEAEVKEVDVDVLSAREAELLTKKVATLEEREYWWKPFCLRFGSSALRIITSIIAVVRRIMASHQGITIGIA